MHVLCAELHPPLVSSICCPPTHDDKAAVPPGNALSERAASKRPAQELVELSWKWLIPQLPFVFRIPNCDLHYKLYLEAIGHLRSTYPPSALTCDVVSTSQQPLSNYHPAFGALVNWLTDKCTIPEGRQVQLDVEATPDSMLDFIIVGMLHVVGINRNRRGGSGRYHESCIMRREQPEYEGERLYQAAFLDLISSLWEDESRNRTRTTWSPMPWSRASLQEAFAAQPADSVPPGQVPTGEALDSMSDEDLIIRMSRSTYGYPLDIPWLAFPHDGYPFCFNLSTYTKIRRTATASLRDDAALWLSAMSFGLLEAVISMKIPEELFLVPGPGKSGLVLSGPRLLRFMSNWLPFMQGYAWPSEEAREERGRQVTLILKRALGALDEEMRRGLSIFLRAGYQEDELLDIIGSVSMMVVVLSGHAYSVWSDNTTLKEVYNQTRDVHRSLYSATVESFEAIMLRAGWCPNTIRSQFMAVHGLLSVISNFARLPPHVRRSADEHKNCTSASCALYTVNEETYVPAHVDPSCNCEHIIPPLDDISSILSGLDGDSWPALTFDGTNLHVQPAIEGFYVAVSHVWADGLGSTSEAGLPACQIARISALAKQLLPESGAFWIDSLCIPGIKHLRKRAIKFMANTYRDAAKVLVLDECIRTECSLAHTWEVNLLRIATSGWVRRIWTLQEGVLGRELCFEFKEGPVDVAEEVSRLTRELADKPDAARISAGFELLYMDAYKPHVPLLAFRADNKGTPSNEYTFGEVIWLLQNRSTSKWEDELVSISSLLPLDVDALLAITGPDAAEMRMKSALLQLQLVSRHIPLLPVAKLSIPGFTWAPRTLTQTYEKGGLSQEGSMALCMEDGLVGEYGIASFETPVLVPPACQDGTQEEMEVLISHRATDMTFTVVLRCPIAPSSFDSLIFLSPELPGDRSTLCAAVLRNGVGLEHWTDEDGPLCCEYASAGLLKPLAWRPHELEGNKINRPLLLSEVHMIQLQIA
ncbi:hypothetical protein OH76DRAFT_1243986 [Lentinus brumalis]|uniref:Heterokaryon incompatibility domain-containing protein n=1 Tax=Lentinus brumalis TaxID=2498619 RepID=A0A371CRZ2_9APHY|nr:hypothetical protein OH76DRAFT_1243986 [Polyporus brumalis]